MKDYTELIEDLRLFHNRSCERCWEYVGANCPACIGKLLEDAADAIDELMEHLADAEFLLGERPDIQWIPVSEELPNSGEEVLTLGPKGGIDCGYYTELSGSSRDKWNWRKHTVKTVKYWIPRKELPESPHKHDKNELCNGTD